MAGLTVTKSGTLTIVLFSKVRTTGVHSQIKNSYVRDSIPVKLGVYGNSEHNTDETCLLANLSNLSNNVETILSSNSYYFRIPVEMRIDLGVDNSLIIEGPSIAHDRDTFPHLTHLLINLLVFSTFINLVQIMFAILKERKNDSFHVHQKHKTAKDRNALPQTNL